MTRVLPAGFRIERVDAASDDVLRKLFEHYLHDMAEWFEFDSNPDGSYAYPTERLWGREDLNVYLAYIDAIPVGFALVGSAEEWLGEDDSLDMDEFFVVRRHRGAGIGHALAEHVWGLHPGRWLVRVYRRNLPAVPFWRSAIAAYVDDAYEEQERFVDGRSWSFFTFVSA